jgi:hypothetical protein
MMTGTWPTTWGQSGEQQPAADGNARTRCAYTGGAQTTGPQLG